MSFDVNEFVDSVFEETPETEATETTVVEEATEENTTSTEEATQQETASEETQQTEEAEAQPTTAERKLTLRFNHETKEVTEAEAIALAQKGMFYDNVSEKIEWLKNLAKANGYENINDYQKAVDDAMTSTKVKEMAKERNIPEDVARELIESKATAERFEAEKTDRDNQTEANRKLVAEIEEFRKVYPDVDVSKLPKEVLNLKAENPNVPLRFLYSTYRESQLATENAVLTKQRQNESAATPSLKSTPETSSFADDVINSVFK